jgi:hypothetical protein
MLFVLLEVCRLLSVLNVRCNMVWLLGMFLIDTTVPGATPVHRKWVLPVVPNMDDVPRRIYAVNVHHISRTKPDYTAQHPRRQPSSYSPPREPEISPETSRPHVSCRNSYELRGVVFSCVANWHCRVPTSESTQEERDGPPLNQTPQSYRDRQPNSIT